MSGFLMVSTQPDEDGEYRLFYIDESGCTVKCGYVYADAVDDVRKKLRDA